MIVHWLSTYLPGDAIFWQAMGKDMLYTLMLFRMFGENWTIYTMHIDILAEPTGADPYQPAPSAWDVIF